MATRNQLKELAQLRLSEAEALFAAGLYDGCVYLCGYVVEFALKAKICTLLQVDEYPDHASSKIKSAYQTHDLDDLALLAGLKNELSPQQREVFENWSIAAKWKTDQRYKPVGTKDRIAAERMLEAVRSAPHGVYSWLLSKL